MSNVRLPQPLKSLLTSGTFRFASLWLIERTDGEVIRLTNHNTDIEFDGNTYGSVGGFNDTAIQKQQGLRAENFEVSGVIETTVITDDDLRAGRYRNAKITNWLVDWQYPWAGAYIETEFWIRETTFTGEMWEATIENLPTKLMRKVGQVYSRQCRHNVGEGICGQGVDMDLMTLEDQTVTSVVTGRRVFETDIGGVLDVDGNAKSNEDDWFEFGVLTWKTGKNAGIKSEVKVSKVANGRTELQLTTPFEIQVGDTFDIQPGCDLTGSTCKTKFKNYDNYGGFDKMPGTTKVMMTPNAKG